MKELSTIMEDNPLTPQSLSIIRKLFRLLSTIKDTTIFIESEDIKTLEIPDNISNVWCVNTNLTELVVPPSVKHLTCDKELIDYELCEVKNVNIVYH